MSPVERLLPAAVIHASPGSVPCNSLHSCQSGLAGRALPADRETGRQLLLRVRFVSAGLVSPFVPQRARQCRLFNLTAERGFGIVCCLTL